MGRPRVYSDEFRRRAIEEVVVRGRTLVHRVTNRLQQVTPSTKFAADASEHYVFAAKSSADLLRKEVSNVPERVRRSS